MIIPQNLTNPEITEAKFAYPITENTEIKKGPRCRCLHPIHQVHSFSNFDLVRYLLLKQIPKFTHYYFVCTRSIFFCELFYFIYLINLTSGQMQDYRDAKFVSFFLFCMPENVAIDFGTCSLQQPSSGNGWMEHLFNTKTKLEGVPVCTQTALGNTQP